MALTRYATRIAAAPNKHPAISITCQRREKDEGASVMITAHEIKMLRRRLGLSQAQMGRLFGGGPRAFQKYESGEVTPSGGMARLLYCANRVPGVVLALQEYTDAEH